jgi:hypothetical protein
MNKLLLTLPVAFALAAPAAASASDSDLHGVCGTAHDKQELVTRQGGSCRSGVALMRGWRNADNPSRYRGYRCGDVPGTHVEFARGGRWFASWQCTKSSTTYRIWTAL